MLIITDNVCVFFKDIEDSDDDQETELSNGRSDYNIIFPNLELKNLL